MPSLSEETVINRQRQRRWTIPISVENRVQRRALVSNLTRQNRAPPPVNKLAGKTVPKPSGVLQFKANRTGTFPPERMAT